MKNEFKNFKFEGEVKIVVEVLKDKNEIIINNKKKKIKIIKV